MNKQQKIALIKNTCQDILASAGYQGRYDFDIGCEAPSPCCIWTDMIPGMVWDMVVMAEHQYLRDTEVIFGIPDWILEDDRWEPEMIQWVYAHECGHAFMGHRVKEEGSPEFIRQEKEADAFASVYFPDVVPENVLALIVLVEMEENARNCACTIRISSKKAALIKRNWESFNGNRVDTDAMIDYIAEYVVQVATA